MEWRSGQTEENCEKLFGAFQKLMKNGRTSKYMIWSLGNFFIQKI